MTTKKKYIEILEERLQEANKPSSVTYILGDVLFRIEPANDDRQWYSLGSAAAHWAGKSREGLTQEMLRELTQYELAMNQYRLANVDTRVRFTLNENGLYLAESLREGAQTTTRDSDLPRLHKVFADIVLADSASLPRK